MTMLQIRLGSEDWLEREVDDRSLEDLLDDPDASPLEAASWDEDTRFDEGWQYAGGESYYRVGRDEAGGPAFIQKSGNPRQTLKYGQILDEAGGVVIPTVVEVEEDAYEGDWKISGKDHTIIQEYVPETFMDRYEDDRITDAAIEDLGRNAAALDKEGFAPTTPSRQLKEMLSDGESTYIVDFGSDIGSNRYGPRDDMYEACLEELDEEDHEPFETGYAEVWEDVPDVGSDDLTY